MKTVIYLVRHGEVQNPEKIFYGRLPGFGLTQRGRQEAQRLAAHLKSRPVAALYSSPLDRTRESASYVHTHFPHLTVVTDERLIEVGSPLEGRPFAEFEPLRWNWFTSKYIKGGGERMSDIWRRMWSFLRQAKARHKGKELVVFSHGDPIMITVAKLSGKPLSIRHIRGPGYVETAGGFALRFGEFGAPEVAKLTF